MDSKSTTNRVWTSFQAKVIHFVIINTFLKFQIITTLSMMPTTILYCIPIKGSLQFLRLQWRRYGSVMSITGWSADIRDTRINHRQHFGMLQGAVVAYAGFFVIWSTSYKIKLLSRIKLLSSPLPSGWESPAQLHYSLKADGGSRNRQWTRSASNCLQEDHLLRHLVRW